MLYTCEWCTNKFHNKRPQRFCSLSCSTSYKNKKRYPEPRFEYLRRTAEQHHSDACLVWPFANDSGYGRVGPKGNPFGEQMVTRIAYLLKYGIIPEDKPDICHHCDNPRCYNWRHLFAGTQQDNMEDKQRKCRGLRGTRHQNARLTEPQVLLIRKLRDGGMTCPDIAEQIGIKNYKHVWKIVTGKLWTHI